MIRSNWILILLTLALAIVSHAVPADIVLAAPGDDFDDDSFYRNNRNNIKKFDVNITETFTGIADCFERTSVLMVNGQFPAPEIRANAGDILEITVRNNLFNSPISIHLHGIDQKKSTFYDGASRISQAPILPGNTFTLRVKTRREQAGTYFYHAHFGLHTIDGPLILVGDKEYGAEKLGYSEEKTVVVSDWWHATADQQIQGLLSSTTFKWVGNADALLINGKSVAGGNGVGCTPVSATNSTALYPTQYDITEVEAGKTYRLRIIGALSLHQVHFQIAGHNLTVIEVDGNYITPQSVSFLSIAPGQRFSVLITANQPAQDYAMAVQYRWRAYTAGSAAVGAGIIRYKNGAPQLDPKVTLTVPTIPAEAIEWGYDFKNHPTLGKPVPTGPPAKEIILNGKQERIDGFLRWSINGVAYQFPSDKPLVAYAYSGTPVPEKSKWYEIEGKGEIIDVIIQGLAGPSGVAEAHPWHLHGHSFWDLGGGPGLYVPGNTTATYASSNPIYRDTVALYPYEAAFFQPPVAPSAPVGWKKIRFIADNPGVWPLHCHVNAHMVMGMMVTLGEGLSNLPRPPRSVVKTWE
ncbi:hypothetical protein HDU97_002772 [Phlyctochytrium planicorne]|nr:hypothetical protein HDU97_002772 [Phlyctochytrium planicorne]